MLEGLLHHDVLEEDLAVELRATTKTERWYSNFLLTLVFHLSLLTNQALLLGDVGANGYLSGMRVTTWPSHIR